MEKRERQVRKNKTKNTKILLFLLLDVYHYHKRRQEIC